MKRKILKIMAISLVIFSLLVNSLLAFVYFTDYLHLGRLIQLTLLVKGRALNGAPSSKLIEGATAGMVKALRDPYSVYLTTAEFTRLQQQMEGIFGGVGLILDTSNESQLKVQGVLTGSPAGKAGVRKGDVITAVNGQPVTKLKAMPAADLLKGPVGSEVILTISRETGKAREFKVRRELINIRSVDGKVLQIPAKVAYIKINSFSDNTADELKEVWNGLPEVRGMVLDLRDNPGGSLDAAVAAADYFLPQGPVVHLLYRSGKRETYQVTGGKLKVPLIVLVNRGSASAAEILAAAVQDTGSGLVVGSKTFGKGVVQTIYGFGESAGLKLTTAKYLSPLGNDINNQGIVPDVAVEEASDTDLVLAQALRLLEGRI